jgi:uncharacterized membrane protein
MKSLIIISVIAILGVVIIILLKKKDQTTTTNLQTEAQKENPNVDWVTSVSAIIGGLGGIFNRGGEDEEAVVVEGETAEIQ